MNSSNNETLNEPIFPQQAIRTPQKEEQERKIYEQTPIAIKQIIEDAKKTKIQTPEEDKKEVIETKQEKETKEELTVGQRRYRTLKQAKDEYQKAGGTNEDILKSTSVGFIREQTVLLNDKSKKKKKK